MHVLYLIDSLVPGGAERSLAALAPHYRDLGITLDVAYLHERDGLHADLEAAGARLHSLAGKARRDVWVRRAARLVRDVRPDVVHTTLFEADVVGRIATIGTRVPVVTSLVNLAYGPEQLANPGLRATRVRAAQLADAITARRVTRFHAVSATVADVMARRLRVRRDRIDVVPRGRDAHALGRRGDERRARARAALGVGDAPVVLAVGRHEYQKGFDVLLRALPEIRSRADGAVVVIAGRDGAATADLHALRRDLGLDDAVVFLGVRDDVADLLCAADVFAFPSRWEGMPGSVIEAMALETPIVATGIAPVVEVVGAGAPIGLVQPDDVHALAAATVDALTGSGGTTAATAALRRRFEDHFTIERAAEGMRDFYERVRRDGRGGGGARSQHARAGR